MFVQKMGRKDRKTLKNEQDSIQISSDESMSMCRSASILSSISAVSASSKESVPKESAIDSIGSLIADMEENRKTIRLAALHSGIKILSANYVPELSNRSYEIFPLLHKCTKQEETEGIFRLS